MLAFLDKRMCGSFFLSDLNVLSYPPAEDMTHWLDRAYFEWWKFGLQKADICAGILFGIIRYRHFEKQ